ncbi:hypothetical protein FQR65_LT03193 [Abscondita terminalis]|nr:hypothetical protein FQR65_LT03193 [Abscondita terminalis]
MHLLNVISFVFLIIAKIGCETKINVAKVNNDPMQVLKTEIEKYKSQCDGSKEEISEKRYSGGSRGSFRNNRTSKQSYDNPDRSGYGYRQDYPVGQDAYVPPSLGYDYRRYRRFDSDEECVSQCVFGYLEVLDDNRSPSETALMKWFHDNAPQDDKRIKAIREIRRCFGHLAASALTSRSIVLAVNSRNSLQFLAYKTCTELIVFKVRHRHLNWKSAVESKMLAVILISSLLISANCLPLDEEVSKVDEPKPQPIEKVQKEVQPAVDNQQAQPAEEAVVGGAPLPDDLSGSPDANPASQPGNSDLDTDATFWGGWGWGYRRPYYGWGSYYSPYRRYGWGRGYGGWGRGWGWGGYYW